MGTRGRYEREVFQGRNKIWGRGKFITGPDYINAILVMVATVVASVLYFTGAFIWLLGQQPAVGIPLFVVSVVLFCSSIALLFLAATSDPGIIPRAAQFEQREEGSYVTSREVQVNGLYLKMKFCETCRIWRPPRASHCSVCNNCVEKFDHHCPYLSNCIGRRNYRLYFSYVSVTATMCVVAIGTSLTTIIWKTILAAQEQNLATGSALLEALNQQASWTLIPVIVIAVPALLFTGLLTGLHLFILMYNNTTTAEKFKRTFPTNALNPYPRRGLSNIVYCLFSRKPPSKIKTGYKGPKWSFPEDCEVYEDGRVLQLGTEVSAKAIVAREGLT